MKKSNPVEPKTKRHIAIRPRITPGAPPGTLSAVPGSAPPRITLFTVSGNVAGKVREIADISRLPKPDAKSKTSYWVRVTGLGDLAPLLAIRDFYGLQNMAFEDLLNQGWRSKMEHSGDYLFFVLQSPPPLQENSRSEHLCMFHKDNLVISFEESPTTLVDSLWQRLSQAPIPAHIRHVAAYCTYAALDMVVDRFYPLLDQKDETLAELEDSLDRSGPSRAEVNRLHRIKRDLITLRRLLAPYREMGSVFRQQSNSLNAEEIRPYLADLGDHIIQAAELVETYHELAKSLDDIFQSMMTNRMNDIIKILTIISTIFMPLTFIAGIYGMNFENMPELTARYGYPVTMLVMVGIVVVMLWFFKKKKWL